MTSFTCLLTSNGALGVVSLDSLSVTVNVIISSTVIILRGVAARVRENDTPGRTTMRTAGRITVSMVTSALAVLTIFLPLAVIANVTNVLFGRLK